VKLVHEMKQEVVFRDEARHAKNSDQWCRCGWSHHLRCRRTSKSSVQWNSPASYLLMAQV